MFSASRNLFAGGGSCINADDCSLTRVVAAEDWGGCVFLKQDNNEVATTSTDSFTDDFPAAYDAIG